MKIVSVTSAFPAKAYSQESISGALKQIWRDRLNHPAAFDRLHANCGVQQRHMLLDLEDYEGIENFGQSNDLWIQAAEDLGEEAITKAARCAQIDLSSVAAFFFVSVTGIASPSIDARLVNRLRLARSIKRIPIFGLGCVAGAAGIARAADYVRAFPDQVALLLSVEICSLSWQHDDLSTANFIASGLFGDGAAAVIVAGDQTGLEGVQVIATRSSFYPDTEDVMGWNISERGFRLVLAPTVPDVIETYLRDDVDGFLGAQGLTRGDIASWIIHTGGPKVLRAIESTLELSSGALDASWSSLRRVGNLSSASVLLVLEEFLRNRRGEPGTYSLLAAMGPGFCSELVLLRW
jgi:alkylresorcinol/alkylpyrone synthase